jgi:hypothetical protein
MTRHYNEFAQVERGWLETSTGGTEGPTHILWRNRLYRVRDVLARWVETGAWWRSSTIRSLHDGAIPPTSAISTTGADERAGSVTVVDTGWDAGEREVWRLEAQAGRSAPVIVFDLALDSATGQWQVLRTHD